MIIVFVIVVVLACAVLGFIVLVQNPKGGGLAANIGGLSNQFMGVKQTTDVLEKGTWIFAAIVALMCIFSSAFIPGTASNQGNLLEKVNTKTTTTNSVPLSNPTPPAGSPQPVAPSANPK